MPRFERVLVADWSASAAPSPARPSPNAIWIAEAGPEGVAVSYHRTRAAAEKAITAVIDRAQGRLLIGFDFPMGYPPGFAERLTGTARASSVWAWLAARMQDGPDNRNNRFALAAEINRAFSEGTGPFWGRPASLSMPDLPERKTIDYSALGLSERRQVETIVPRAQAVWKLYTTGAAGAQGLVGQAMIHRLSQRPGVAVWPFEMAEAKVVLAEVYPSLLERAVRADKGRIKDEIQVRLLAKALYSLSQTGQLSDLLAAPPLSARGEEGWILGAGQQDLLETGL